MISRIIDFLVFCYIAVENRHSHIVYIYIYGSHLYMGTFFHMSMFDYHVAALQSGTPRISVPLASLAVPPAGIKSWTVYMCIFIWFQ